MRYKRKEGTNPESVYLYLEIIKEATLQKQTIKAGDLTGVDIESGKVVGVDIESE